MPFALPFALLFAGASALAGPKVPPKPAPEAAPAPAPAHLAPAPPAPGPGPVLLKLQDQGVFLGEGAWAYLPLASDALRLYQPNTNTFVEVPLQADGRTLGYRSIRQGCVWDIRQVPGPDAAAPSTDLILYRLPLAAGGAWERVARIETDNGIPNYLVPLDREGDFLAVGPFFGFHEDGKASPVAKFHAQGDRLAFQGLVPLPFDALETIGKLRVETLTRPAPAGSEVPPKPLVVQRFEIKPECLRPSLWTPALLPGHLALCATQAGVIWTLDLKTGDCDQTINLGGLALNDMDGLTWLDHFILAAQADPDGRLVVVTRDPDALTFAVAMAPPPGLTPEALKLARRRYKDITEPLTRVRWWSVDPDTGKTERIDQPGSFPETVPFQQQTSLRFLIGPDNQVHANVQGPWSEILEAMKLKRAAQPGTQDGPAPRRKGGAPAPAAAPEPAPATTPSGTGN